MPAHNPDFKGEKMKKKAVKKGTPSAKTLRGLRSAPSKKPRKVMVRGKVGHRMVVKKPFRLRVGKYYANRGGKIVGPLRKSGVFPYPYCENPGNAIDLWTTEGRFYSWGQESPFDLIREVPPPKSPKGRGK